MSPFRTDPYVKISLIRFLDCLWLVPRQTKQIRLRLAHHFATQVYSTYIRLDLELR